MQDERYCEGWKRPLAGIHAARLDRGNRPGADAFRFLNPEAQVVRG
jgi:hypothetical protein